MRWAILGILILVFIFAAPLGLLGVYVAYHEVSRYLFYERHPLLKAMRDAPPISPRMNEPWPQMTDVLMKRVPPGSTRTEALRTLSEEKLKCGKPNPQSDLLVCGPADAPSNVGRWWIELAFNDDDRVSRGRVLRLK